MSTCQPYLGVPQSFTLRHTSTQINVIMVATFQQFQLAFEGGSHRHHLVKQ